MKYVVTLNGKNYEVEVDKAEAVVTSVTDIAPKMASVPVATTALEAAPAPVAAPVAKSPDNVGGTKIISPMPGTILSTNVSVGDKVKAGDIIVVLEAMKMENEIVSPNDGTVTQLLTQKGSTVNTDDLLAIIG